MDESVDKKINEATVIATNTEKVKPHKNRIYKYQKNIANIKIYDKIVKSR